MRIAQKKHIVFIVRIAIIYYWLRWLCQFTNGFHHFCYKYELI